MVPANARLGKDQAVDSVVARAYTHAALPGRTVVRLTAESVVMGDDLEMATLGFGAGASGAPVGKERRRPLGFPGWALVHDPKNARFALDVVKEFKKQARKAKSKPGHAKEGIDAIAAKLGKSVPHFLPSFYEEAGRAFIEHGAQTFAAAMFGKAREAEAVHALEVDEQHRIDGFLEFALAGAVTTKALSQYAKDLEEHHEPKAAYGHFRQLCVQRTLGGMPPWSGMAKELRRLAKAAKLDTGAEDAALIAEIIESPALAKAAGEFWRAYAEPITALGKANASARGTLLNLFPTGSSQHNADLDDAWLELLDATGAVHALVDDGAPAEAQPSGGRAAWFDKLTQHVSRGYRSVIPTRVFALLRRMAPKLILDEKPITCAARYGQVDLDLAELALELGVPVGKAADGHVRVDVWNWAQHVSEPERGRDPVRCAVHPLLGPALRESVAYRMGSEPFDTAARGKAGYREAKRIWIEALIAGAESGALPAIANALAQVHSKVKAETFGEFPELHARFAALDVAPAFARTLRIGIPDEFGYPALEEAVAELNPDGKVELTLHGGAPALIVATKTRAIAVGPTERLGVHDFVIPARHDLLTIRFIGAQFLVVLRESWNKTRAYWSSAPHDLFDTEISGYGTPTVSPRAALLPDGAWQDSKTAIRVGDRALSIGGLVASDGTTCWTQEWKDGQVKWRELSASGEAGRHSFPAFIEAGLDDEWQFDASSYVLPAPVASSPLGVANGLVGMRVRTKKGAALRDVESIDGMRWRGEAGNVVALAKFPGRDEPRPLLEAGYGDAAISILSADGNVCGANLMVRDRRYMRGSSAVLGTNLWHLLQVRDAAGSQRLAAITDGDARALLAEVPPRKADDPIAVLRWTVQAVTHPKLRTGVDGIAAFAVELQAERDRLAAERAPGAAAAALSAGPSEAALFAGLAGWAERAWSTDGSAWAQIERVGEELASDDRSNRDITALPSATLAWFDLAVAPSALAFVALALGTPAKHRKDVSALLGQLAKCLPLGDKLRAYHADGTLDFTGTLPQLFVRWSGGNAYVVRRVSYYNNQFQVLEYAPGGTFAPPPGMTLRDVALGTAPPSAEATAELESAVAAGKTSWSADAAARLAAATGLTSSEATFLWAGCPNANDRSSNFIDKELREQLGLKVVQAEVARDSLNATGMAKRLAAVAAAGRAGIAAILDGSAVDAFAAEWKRLVGERIQIPEELAADADRELWAPLQPSQALAMIGNATTTPHLNIDGVWALDGNGRVIRVSKPEPLVGQTAIASPDLAFDVNALRTALTYIPFIYAELPVGHPLRAQAALAHDRLVARLANPALWIDVNSKYMSDVEAQAMDRMLDGLGGEMLPGMADTFTARHIPGAVIVRNAQRAELKIQPAAIDAKARPIVDRLARDMSPWGTSFLELVDLARSANVTGIAQRIRETPVPEGGWEQNPTASAPAIVNKAAKKLGVSKDAAALYLQYLTLLWPTPKNLQQWNAWKSKQFETANEELVERELILPAKRERAQRGHFLPGGWEALKSPHPPMESWKLPLYGTRRVMPDSPAGAAGVPDAPLGRFLALAPFHVLFERAWSRVESGDVPAYEEVKR